MGLILDFTKTLSELYNDWCDIHDMQQFQAELDACDILCHHENQIIINCELSMKQTQIDNDNLLIEYFHPSSSHFCLAKQIAKPDKYSSGDWIFYDADFCDYGNDIFKATAREIFEEKLKTIKPTK